MKKLSTLLDDIAKAAHEQHVKVAQDKLSNSKTSPTISSDLGLLMLKTAALLKEANSEVSYEDVHKLMEHIRNA